MARYSTPHRRGASLMAVDLGVSTAYAVRGHRTVLVDTGPANSERRLLRKLGRAGIDPDSITLILLTHYIPTTPAMPQDFGTGSESR